MTKRPKLTPSLEDYLEAVLALVRRGRVARVRDIARRLGVGSPSVTAALKSLSKRGLVNYDPYQVVTLTDRGQEAAEEIQKRHDVIRGFLTDVLGVEADAAEDYACRMEHAVDETLLARLGRLVEFVRRGAGGRDGWLAAFRRHCSAGPRAKRSGGPKAGASTRSRKRRRPKA